MNDHEGLSRHDFEALRSFVYSEAGIHLGPEKRTMLETRLKRRMRNLHFSSCAEYCKYVFGPGADPVERVHLIDVVTTNKTDFFREPGHFDYLLSEALPDLAARFGPARRSLIWSAGCSTGEEPYTLAMVLSEYARECQGFRFHIVATDISTEVLAKAIKGVYRGETVRPVPLEMQRLYLMRSREANSDLVRIVPELRSAVEFRRLNFMDADYGMRGTAEAIFCRNVIIYFDRATQKRILQKLTAHLATGGYFFAGHSESLQGMDLPLIPVAPSVYRKQG